MKQEGYAVESEKTLRAREKLKKQLESYDRKMTREALEKKTSEIQRWISSRAHNRVALKNKEIALFNENQNAADVSSRISKVAQKLSMNVDTSSS